MVRPLLHARKKRSPMHNAVRRTLGVLFIAAFLWGLALIPYDIFREERFRLYGEVKTVGLVTAVRTLGAGEDSLSRYGVEYAYVDRDGFARRAVAPMPRERWADLRPGSRVVVYFAKSQPGLSRIRGQVEPVFQVWLRDMLD